MTATPVIADWEHFQSAEPSWRDLEQSGACSPYQRFDWISTYTEAMLGRDISARVLTIRHGVHPVLLLPVMIRRVHGVRVASPIGAKHANYHCPVMARGASDLLDPELMRQLLRKAARPLNIDLYAFQNLPFSWDGERNVLVLPGAQPSPSSVPMAALPADPETLLNSIGTSEARRKLRRKREGLAALGLTTHRVARDASDVNIILTAFFQQKGERFDAQGVPSPFADARSQEFVRSLCLRGLSNGQPAVELHGLFLDDRCVATHRGAVHGPRFSCMFNSFDQSPEIARFSPGDLLLAEVIRSQCGMGRTMFDLGVGEARYKRFFCSDVEDLVDVLLPVTGKGWLYAECQQQALRAKRTIKHSPALWRAVQVTRRLKSNIRSAAAISRRSETRP